MLRKIFNWTNLFGTIFIFLTIGLISMLGVQLEFLNVVAEVFEDFSVTDKYYSIPYYEPGTPPKDRPESFNDLYRDSLAQTHNKEIVLVNIAYLNRAQLAQQIAILAECQPKVIALDVRLPQKPYMLMEPEARAFNLYCDSVMEATLVKYESQVPIIFASELDTGNIELKKGVFTVDSILMPDPRFRAHTHTAFVNVLSEGTGRYRTWRDIPVKAKHGKDIEYSLGVAAMRYYDRPKYERFLQRGNVSEVINWRGNIEHFPRLEYYNVLDKQFAPEFVKDKIVMLGYLGREDIEYGFLTDEDRYYTPMNYSQVGRSQPDMWGVVGHANVASMIMAEDYVDISPGWFNYLVAVVLCFLNVSVFYLFNTNNKTALWYNLLSKIVVLVETVLLSMAMFFSVGYFNVKVDLTLAILVVVLSSDVAEIYMDAILPTYRRFVRKRNQRRHKAIKQGA